MPSINFKPQFADLVRTGTKTQTIRPLGKLVVTPGSTLYLYKGLRTKQAERLAVGRCVAVERIVITVDGIVEVGRQELHEQDMQSLVWKDGFRDTEEFLDFFHDHYGLPFEGRLIRWEIMPA